MTMYVEDFEEGERCPLCVLGSDNVQCAGHLRFMVPDGAPDEDATLQCDTCLWEIEDLEY